MITRFQDPLALQVLKAVVLSCSSKIINLGSSIKYKRKIFRKTNISNTLIRHVRVRIRGLEMLVFREILRTYLMDDPFRGSQ